MSLNFKSKTVEEKTASERIDCTNLDFVKAIQLDKSVFDTNLTVDRKILYGQFTDNEKNVLFNVVQWLKPKKVVEFSPSQGYTTCVIYAALKVTNTEIEYFDSYEVDPEAYRQAQHNLSTLGFDKVNFVLGDVLEKMNLDRWKDADFIFIDSDHEKSFVQKYVDKFFPLIKKGTWVAIHDVTFVPMNGETEVIVKWLKDNDVANYFFICDLAKLFGVDDNAQNPFNPSATERSSTLWFKV